MTLKRFGALLLASALSVTILAGCGEKGGASAIDADATAQSVMEKGGYTEVLVKQEDSVIGASYTLLDLTQVESYAVYVSGSGATPEEVAIVTAKSDSDVESVRAAIDRRVDDLKFNFQDYHPEEMPKIESAVIVQKGRTVMLAICPESDAVRELLEKL